MVKEKKQKAHLRQNRLKRLTNFKVKYHGSISQRVLIKNSPETFEFVEKEEEHINEAYVIAVILSRFRSHLDHSSKNCNSFGLTLPKNLFGISQSKLNKTLKKLIWLLI